MISEVGCSGGGLLNNRLCRGSREVDMRPSSPLAVVIEWERGWDEVELVSSRPGDVLLRENVPATRRGIWCGGNGAVRSDPV